MRMAARPAEVIALTPPTASGCFPTGKLTLVDNQVDIASGTIRLKAEFENKDHALWPGLSVSTRLLVDDAKDAVVVPDDAVQARPRRSLRLRVDDDNKAELRKIKVTRSIDGRTVVERARCRASVVVTAGQYGVQPGAVATDGVANSESSGTAKAGSR